MGNAWIIVVRAGNAPFCRRDGPGSYRGGALHTAGRQSQIPDFFSMNLKAHKVVLNSEKLCLSSSYV